MIRVKYFLVVSLIMILFSSCFEDIDNWYTTTKEFDGRYSVAVNCENLVPFHNELFGIVDPDGDDAEYALIWYKWDASGNAVIDEDRSKFYGTDWDYNNIIENGMELMIYNSANNVIDEIIFDTRIGVSLANGVDGFNIKGKFKVTGNSNNFKGTTVTNNIFSNPQIDDHDYFILPGQVDEDFVEFYATNYDPQYAVLNDYYWHLSELEDVMIDYYEIVDEDVAEFNAIQLYTRISLEEGKITPGAATTIGGNKADAVSMKFTTYCDFITLEKYQTDPSTWADPPDSDNPGTPEFDLRIKDGSRRNADGWEEHWTLTGYRYTGYPEDDPNIDPPIVEK